MFANPLVGSVPSVGPGESYAPREARRAKKLDLRPLATAPIVVVLSKWTYDTSTGTATEQPVVVPCWRG
jgi:hypothetical protein